MTERPGSLQEDSSQEELDLPVSRIAESPRHGFRGEPADFPAPIPAGLSIALSREAGARGGSIAKRAGVKLGWQVYSQDLLEYISQEGTFRRDVVDQLPAAALEWVEDRLNRLHKEQNLSRHPSVVELARMVLSLGAQGEVILLGRGAGCILPARTTLNVRLVAPLADRVAYMSEWLRLTEEEAADHVRRRDSARAEFIATHFHRKPADIHQYDLILNSSLLGEESCADLIVQAARAKMSAFVEDLD
ncbi:MAG: cytidylate kinase-like family protein [Planctomycetes bacterium]|nr:cytidylate kinase-like family protein [Planctomycetota bacterium]